MNRVTRGEKILNTLTDEGVISQCGKDWLIAAIDPFHDRQLAFLQGWPDLESGNSVVRCVKQSMTVKAPASAPDNWDAHVLMWPWLNSGASNGTSFSASTSRSGQTFGYNVPPSVQGPIGGLQCYGVPSGENLDLLQVGNSRQIGRMDMDSIYTRGAGRLVGMGFEVHNTTATLQQQGACTVYRMMANAVGPSLMIGVQNSGDGISYPVSGQPVRFPPRNTQEALLLQGSRQWEAREGCYVVAAFNDAENPARPIQQIVPIIAAAGQDDSEGTISTTAVNFPNPGIVAVDTFVAAAPNFRVHPVHQSGAIFTGLSQQSTLTINWNVYYESFPGLAELDILPLASPSCEYDPDALDLFERIIQALPVGVKVKENGLGDWFLSAVAEASKFISPILMGTGNPLAMAAGTGLKYVGDTAGNYVKKALPPPNSWESEGGGQSNNYEPSVSSKSRQTKKKKKTNNKGISGGGKPKGKRQT